jgi:hypothetical protein
MPVADIRRLCERHGIGDNGPTISDHHAGGEGLTTGGLPRVWRARWRPTSPARESDAEQLLTMERASGTMTAAGGRCGGVASSAAWHAEHHAALGDRAHAKEIGLRRPSARAART